MNRTALSALLACAAVTLGAPAQAQDQAPAQAQSAAQTAPSQEQDAIRAILGALFGDQFGTSSSLETEWSRGRRPLANQRTQFESRINADVRSGRLSRYEGDRLREEYQSLVDLEARYTSGGRVTLAERTELLDRYRAFSQRLQGGSSNGGTGVVGGGGTGNGWVPLSQGQQEFGRRVDAQVSARRLSRTEGTRLKNEYQGLIQSELVYTRDGLSASERQDLQTRLDDLNRRVGDNVSNGGTGSGWGGGLDNHQRLDALDSDISRAERAGTISRSEAAELRIQQGDLYRLDAAYARLNPSQDERDYLTRRIGELEQRLGIRR
ncbi:MAG: hypothetical protein HZY74_10520 [Brevundimonas sp.]|nr:MAG: hypothetical protein HZY74_10520 [Brevundimonas sp.]